MANNVNITAGAGTVIATEQDSSSPNEHYQKIKIVDGTANSYTPLKVNSDGTVNVDLHDGSGSALTSTSNALDVNIKSGSSAGTQYAEGSTASTATGNLSMAKNGTTLKALQADSSGNLQVNINASTATIPVSGTFWPGTQPVSGTVTANAGTGTFAVSAASLPLPSGAATAAKQPALGTAGTASSDVLSVQGITSMTPLKVDGSGVTQPISGTITANAGTNLNTSALALESGGNLATLAGTVASSKVNVNISSSSTVPVSAASLPLPTGAATAAKQPTLGTAGSASADVISVQGVASMTALKVDGSGVTQPVSGTVTANAGTGTFAVSAVSLPLPTGAATAAKQPALGTAGSASTDVLSVQGIASMTALKVDGSAVTQPVSGTVTANQGGTWTVQPGNTANTTPWLIAGGAAANASPSGNPLRNGVLGRSTLPTEVTSGNMVDILADRFGRLYRISPILANANSNGTAITTATDTQIIAAPSANNHLRIHRLWAQNSGATGTWCYWGNGSGVKTIPFYLAQNQPMMMTLQGSLELTGGATPTGLYLHTNTAGANIEWYAEYESLAD